MHALRENAPFGARGPKKVLGVYRGNVRLPGLNVSIEINKGPDHTDIFNFYWADA